MVDEINLIESLKFSEIFRDETMDGKITLDKIDLPVD